MLDLQMLKIPVTDLSRSTEFYSTALGLQVLFQADEFGWAQMGGADVDIALYVPGLGGGDRVPGGHLDFQLQHPDVSALAASLPDMDPAHEIHTNADGSRSLEFMDPDGNILKIMQASPPPT